MREILFKAKRKGNGEWVEGYYVPHIVEGKIVHHYILTSEASLEETKDDDLVLDFYREEIDPNTLCQCTGITDKNGKKIWENDIISISAYSYYEPEDDYFGVVKYCIKDACWSLCNEASDISDIICECFGSYTTEIINHGNIFDDLELLKED